LHTLERGLKAPRRLRPQARVTVMRLEGAESAAQPSTQPPRLPKDLEDQIAVVRGRAVGKPSRGLLQLEERLLRTHDPESAPPLMQRHEHGTMPLSAIHAPRPLVRAASLSDNVFQGRYNVESFEDAAQPVAQPISGYCAGTAPAALAPAKVQPDAVAAAVAMQGPALPAAGASGQSRRRERQNALTRDQQAVAADFERDVAAMLGTTSAVNAPEDRQWDDTLRNAARPPAAAAVPASDAPAAPEAPRRDAHEVFNQMGLAMNFANSFDLGAMDLSARFDRFDQELAPPAGTKPAASDPVPVQALGLDDFDLVADLAEISGERSAPPAAQTTSEQSVTKQDQI
jgi:hypothetical protein